MELLIILSVVTWLKGTGLTVLIGVVGGVLAKQGYTLLLKKIAQKGEIVCKELQEVSAEGEDFMRALNNSIKEDGSLKQNSIPELLKEGKEFWGELKDMVVIFKPKKT